MEKRLPTNDIRQTRTIEEAAKILGIGRNQAYELARAGRIPTIRLGKRLLVLAGPLSRMLQGEGLDERQE